MPDILQFFTEDKTTYSQQGIIMYSFDEKKSNEFLASVVDFYRRAYISDEKLQKNIDGMGTSRKEEISKKIPTEPIIKSGEFGEILSYLLFTSLNPDYNVKPLRWRWKEDKDRAVHFSDIMLLSCPDKDNPQPTDKTMTVEVKTRATRPGKSDSSINDAIGGALNDSVERNAKTLTFLLERFEDDEQYDLAKIVLRFQDAVAHPYQSQHNAIAIVDTNYFASYHIGNLNAQLINKVKTFNRSNAASNRKISVFVIPFADLKSKYENLYKAIPNS